MANYSYSGVSQSKMGNPYQKAEDLGIRLSLTEYVQKKCHSCGSSTPEYELLCPKCGQMLVVSMNTQVFLTALQDYTDLLDQQRTLLNKNGKLTELLQSAPAIAAFVEQQTVAMCLHDWIERHFPNLLREIQTLRQRYPGLNAEFIDLVNRIDGMDAKFRKTLRTIQASPLPNPFVENFRAYALAHGKCLVEVQKANTASQDAPCLVQLKSLKTQIEADFKAMEQFHSLQDDRQRFLNSILDLPIAQRTPSIRRMTTEYDLLVRIARATSQLTFQNGFPINSLVAGGL